MKITDIRACQPRCASPPDWRTSLGQILVAVDTDAGLTGYGVGGGGLAAIHIIRTVLRDLLLGRDPEPIETLWEEMFRATLPFGRKGVAIMALSGVDLALWDLRGKAERKPVAELLGGVRHRTIPVYGTVWGEIPDEVIGEYHAYKLHLGAMPASKDVTPLLEAVVAAQRKLGMTYPLMVDAWMQWDVPFTVRFAQEYKAQAPRLATATGQLPWIRWIEEPLPPDDLAGYAELATRCSIPIAGGEHEFTAAAFAELAERRLHHVLQPDVSWCGGMTQLVRIYEVICRYPSMRVCPHRGAEVWALHAIAALDPYDPCWAEKNELPKAEPLAESGRPWMTWVGGQPPVRKGYVTLTDAPGFGVTIDEAHLPT